MEENAAAVARLEHLVVQSRAQVLGPDIADAMLRDLHAIGVDVGPLLERYRSFFEVVQEATGAVQGLRGVADRIDLSLAQAHRDFTRLSPQIAGERRIGFWLWEFGGAVGLFGLANVLAFPALAEVLQSVWLGLLQALRP